MNSGELYDRFRSDVVDVEKPYLWSEDEVWGYMDAAYKLFVRDTDGIGDATSSATEVSVSAGEAFSDVHPSILKFRQAFLASTGAELNIINTQDTAKLTTSDYGVLRSLNAASQPGPVRNMIVGLERGKVRWAQVPVVDDTVNLVTYRLPLAAITGDGQGFEIGEEHHIYLLLGMKAQAYQKQDAETFDRGRATDNEARFTAYCAKAKAEAERYKSKPVRSVVYGGI